jgi:hypothetical protein
LLAFRLFAGIFYFGYGIWCLAKSAMEEIKFFTDWGINITAITFMLLSID